MRKVFFGVCFVAFLLVFCTSVGAPSLFLARAESTPGLGIHAMAVLSAILLLQVSLYAVGQAWPALLGRIDGIVKLVAGVLSLLAGIVLALAAFAELMVMLALLMAIPFGLPIYLVKYGDFPADAAQGLLSWVVVLCLIGGVALLLWSQHVLQSTSMILLWLSVVLLSVLLSFLIALPPGFLCALTDAIGAIVIAVVGAIWGVVVLLFGVRGVVKVAAGAK